MFVNVSPSFADVCLRFLAQGPSRRLRVASSSSASPVQTRVDLIPRPRRTPHLQIWPNLYAMAQAVSSVFFPAPCNHPFARALGEAGEFLAAPTSHPVLLLMHDVRRPVVALVRPAGGGAGGGAQLRRCPPTVIPGNPPSQTTWYTLTGIPSSADTRPACRTIIHLWPGCPWCTGSCVRLPSGWVAAAV